MIELLESPAGLPNTEKDMIPGHLQKDVAKKASASLAILATQLRSSGSEAESGRHFVVRSLSSSSTAFGGLDESVVHLMVRCEEETPVSELLSGRGKIRTSLIPVSKIPELLATPGVLRVSAPRILKPLEIAKPLLNVPQFRVDPATTSSGKGVLIGIVDTGIDLAHPAFSPDRILAIWDQTLRGKGPGGNFPAIGKVLTGQRRRQSQDTNGHGTHVAGIAAGGKDGDQYCGIAPDADLLIVKTNFSNVGIQAAVEWIFSEATRLNRPAVVNLSLGGHSDAHDGSDDLAVAIDGECGPGRLVVAAAGNEGNDAIHAKQRVTPTSPAVLPFDVASASSGSGTAFIELNGWYSGNGKCDVKLTSPTGQSTGWQTVISASSADGVAMSYRLRNDRVVVATPEEKAPNGDRQFIIAIEAASDRDFVQGGRWLLEVRRAAGSVGNVDVWLITPPSPRTSASFVEDVTVYAELIGSPGSASQALTVAAYTSRNEWTTEEGSSYSLGERVGEVASFSSPGPLRGGALKPDVAAPGAMVASAASAQADSDERYSVDESFRVDAGTSMAAPMVTGVLALLLERNPMLDPDQAKQYLKVRSRIPGLAIGTFDPKWGYGLLRL